MLAFRIVIFLGICLVAMAANGADIQWKNVEETLKQENARLAKRNGGHGGEYFVVCTIYYTPRETGFTKERGFDVTSQSAQGLDGRKYPADFLWAVRKEGVGRLAVPVRGNGYIRYEGRGLFRFCKAVTGRGGVLLVPKKSCAVSPATTVLGPGATVQLEDEVLQKVVGNQQWEVADTGGGLRKWQIDLYWGEDDPNGPGNKMTMPAGTDFRFARGRVRLGGKEEEK